MAAVDSLFAATALDYATATYYARLVEERGLKTVVVCLHKHQTIETAMNCARRMLKARG